MRYLLLLLIFVTTSTEEATQWNGWQFEAGYEWGAPCTLASDWYDGECEQPAVKGDRKGEIKMYWGR